MAKVRLNLEVSEELDQFLDRLSADEGTTKADIVRRGIAVMKAYSQQIQAGNTHIGFSNTPGNLNTELVGLLDSLALRAERDRQPVKDDSKT